MCGIIGIFGNNSPKQRARKSLEKITHRGSNVFELKHFPNGTLGANRLPIVDREFGKQPQSNCNNTIFAAQNGEIFNYIQLRDELIQKGCKFKTNSDTEVLAHLYEKYGTDMVEKIDSEMFAFVIYDKKNDAVFAARDMLGVKPLYYAQDKKGQWYFASEIKQLSFFEDIEKIKTFPPGTYFINGKFKKYYQLEKGNKFKKEDEIIKLLEPKLVEAVRKRVQTDLPIGVFLSGGVDSSLIMEIATRLHPDVTAIILGYPGSSDYEFALRLCKGRGYKYHVIRPDVDYENELDNIIYHLETYEPLIIRHSFSLDMCSREAHRLGLRVVLVGEGADELFAGYNEFASLPDNLINDGSKMLTESLHFGHLQRVDRMSMKHTVEVRSPFFDKEVVEMAMQIYGQHKVKRDNHQITTKYILRKIASDFLPDYIAWRYKVPFSNGAGMNVGNNYKAQDGDVAKVALNKEQLNVPSKLLNKYSVNTKEGEYYLGKFDEFKYTKLIDSSNRLVIKDNLNELYKSKKKRLVVAEFGRLAIYFPTYFAAEKGIFSLHKLDVDFIATGGDDRTYASLVNNSAHIGLADPMFAMFENPEGIKGEIIGELVNRVPNVAVCINPSIKIDSLQDFAKYKIGTFQEFTTTNGIARYFLPKETDIKPYDYKSLIDKLIAREIDIAIVIPEQGIDLEALGGKIVFDFRDVTKHFLYSGFTIANILEKTYKQALKSFLVSTREATRFVLKNKEESYKTFVRLFPNLKEPKRIFDYYLNIWSSTIKVEKEDYAAARKMWNSNYPNLLKKYTPYFRTTTPADVVIEKINARNYRRDFPFLEDELHKKISSSLASKKALNFIGFWGAGSKLRVDNTDKETIQYFKEYIKEVNKVFKPGVKVTFILADEHAKNNGYKATQYKKYLSEIKKLIEKEDFSVVYLSELWDKWKMSHSLITKKLNGYETNWWKGIVISRALEEQAKKRFQLSDKISGAQRYYIMRMFEKKHLEQEFKDSVFFTFTDGYTQSIYPKMSTLYLYTTSRGKSEVPWFNN